MRSGRCVVVRLLRWSGVNKRLKIDVRPPSVSSSASAARHVTANIDGVFWVRVLYEHHNKLCVCVCGCKMMCLCSYSADSLPAWRGRELQSESFVSVIQEPRQEQGFYLPLCCAEGKKNPPKTKLCVLLFTDNGGTVCPSDAQNSTNYHGSCAGSLSGLLWFWLYGKPPD